MVETVREKGYYWLDGAVAGLIKKNIVWLHSGVKLSETYNRLVPGRTTNESIHSPPLSVHNSVIATQVVD